MEKATFQDLIARKLQRDNDKLQIKEITVSSIGKALLFKKPSDAMIMDVADEIGDGESTKKIIEAYKRLIYLCCTELQNTELHNEMGVVDPFDTVSAIMEVPEILSIGGQLVGVSALTEVGEKVKN